MSSKSASITRNHSANSVGSASILMVLETALPSTLVQEALTNSASVASEISSEFAAGQTPTWFTGLPSDVQTYLVPLATNPASLNNLTSANATMLGGAITTNSSMVSASQSAILSQLSAQNSSAQSMATMTSATGSGVTTAGGSSGSSASSGSSGSSATSKAGASPTGIIGMGLIGAAGLLGVFAL